jgi:hypothetical protein
MKYSDFFKYLIENSSKDEFGKEGEDWVRPGSDLEAGMEKGETNFPFGYGYPNYKPKKNDREDFEDVCHLNYIADVPYEHSSADTKKRWIALKIYIKRKYNIFYKKYQEFIDELFINNDEMPGHWGFDGLIFAKEHPGHSNIPKLLQGIEITDEDLDVVKKIEHFYYNDLMHLIHHRNDPKNELNYPLHVTLYDVTRALGGYEEGGWWYDKYTVIKSKEVRSPEEVIPVAEELYSTSSYRRDGKPCILIEKETGSQVNPPPTYS